MNKNIIRKIGKKLFGTDEKDKIILINVVGSFGIKGLALIISFLSMPVYIEFFRNDEILGVWFTILSIMTWILSFDLGIGNGLRNKLVHCFNNNDKDTAKKYISSAYILYACISIIMSIVGVYIILNIDVNKFLSIDNSTISAFALKKSVIIIYLGIVLQLLFKLITSIMYSLQKSAIPNILALITSILQFLFVLLYKTNNGVEHKFLILSIIYFISVNMPLLIATIVVFKKILIGYSPKLYNFSKESIKDVLLVGGVFFWVQIMFMLFTASNEIIIMSFFGPSNVVQYSVYNKVYTLLPLIIQVLMTPFWSAITKAKAQKDYKWLNKTLGNFTKFFVISIIVNLAILLSFDFILKIWLGGTEYIGNSYFSIIYSIYGIVFVSHMIYSTYACGLNDLKLQFKIYTIGVIIKVPSIIILSKFTNSWIIVILINILIMGIYSFVERLKLKKYITSKL